MRTRRHRSGVVFDLGAAYVHGTIGNPLTELAEEAGIELKQVSESNPWVENASSVALYSGGKRATAAEVAETDAAFFELMRRVTARAQGCESFVRASGEIRQTRTTNIFWVGLLMERSAEIQSTLYYGYGAHARVVSRFNTTAVHPRMEPAKLLRVLYQIVKFCVSELMLENGVSSNNQTQGERALLRDGLVCA